MTVGTLIFALLSIAYVLQVLKLRSDLADARYSAQLWKERTYEVERLASKRDWQFFSIVRAYRPVTHGSASLYAQISYSTAYPEATGSIPYFDLETADLEAEMYYTRAR